MTKPMPLRPTTVRFAQDAMDLIQAAAKEAGVSVSQFVREAAIMRAAYLLRDRPELVEKDQLVDRLARRSED